MRHAAQMRWLTLALRIFIVTGILSALVQWLTLGGFVAAVILGCVFGLFMTAFCVGLTAWRLRGRGGDPSPKQSARLELPAPVDTVRPHALAALQALPAKRIDADRLTARTKITWWSWGEVVSVQLTAAGEHTVATVSSRPRIRTTLVDYGRGRDAVERTVRFLSQPGAAATAG